MKKKKLEKIFKKSLTDFKNKVDNNKAKSEKMKYSLEPAHNQFNDYIFSNSDDLIKDKTRNMIFRLLKLRDNLQINIHEKTINISSEYGLKKSNVVNYNQSYNSVDYFNLEIIKETGYILTYKEKRVAFKDETLYDDTVSKVTEIFKELNSENFRDLYNEIMVESGLARESNLDDLLEN